MTTSQQKIEVGQYYVLGYTVAEIEKKTGVSHGNICGITKDFESGKLQIPGLPSEEVSALRQLSLQLKKTGLAPAQGLLGVSFFGRCTDLGIAPSQLDQWADLVKTVSPSGFPVIDFLEAALYLHELEKTEKLSFQEIIQKYSDIADNKSHLENEIASLDDKRAKLDAQVSSLNSEVVKLQGTKAELSAQTKLSEGELKKSMEATVADKGVRGYLKTEIQGLSKKKAALESEIGGREESLNVLKELGLSEAHLLQLKNIVGGIAAKQGLGPEQIKINFFGALGEFGGLPELIKAAEDEKQHVQDLKTKAATLAGEIASLETQRAGLVGEVKSSAAKAAEGIQQAGEKAVLTIGQCVGNIETGLKALMEDTILTGLAIGKETEMQKTAGKSAEQLDHVVEEIKLRAARRL